MGETIKQNNGRILTGRDFYEEVREDAADMQREIDEANKQIDKNNKDQNPNNDVPVNEKDFGDHGVDFDSDHSDRNGNLDSSVEDITTDPRGDMTNTPLPDPNKTGAEFDRIGEITHGDPTIYGDSYYNQNTNGGWVESVPVDDGYYFEDAWVEYGNFNEEIVNQYVNYLSSDNYGGNLEFEPFEYTK